MKISTMAAFAAADARIVNASALPTEMRVSTDSRTLAPGDAFLALSGDNFDGHRFVAQALERGAGMLVVSDASVVPDGVGALLVTDTRAAYLAFGGVARKALRAKVAAITGSVGKTTTKAFLEQILRHATGGKVLATPANENNEIGVAKLLLDAEGDEDYLVVEMGARHYGEIETLARAALPDVAVLTNIGEAHLEIFGTRERLAETKWGIFATGAHPVLNALDHESLERAPSLMRDVTWFEDKSPDDERGEWRLGFRTLALRALDASGYLLPDLTIELSADGPRKFDRREPGWYDRLELVIAERGIADRALEVELRVPGVHNFENVLAAAAAAIELEVDAGSIAEAFIELELPSGRYEKMQLGKIAVIYDAYNASLTGMLSTLRSFALEPAERRIAVLSSMAELGEHAPGMHRNVGAHAAAAALGTLLVGGDYADDIASGAHDAGMESSRIVPFADNAAAVAWLRANAQPGDLVLLKGSRRYHLEEIVEGLRA